MINAVPLKSDGRQPRGIVQINGVPLPWISFEVDNNNFYLADTFHVEMSLSELPHPYGFQFWASEPAILIDIYAGFPPNSEQYVPSQLKKLITGQVDNIDIDPVTQKVTLTGRDLTAKFIDNKTTEKFQNLTSSQVAILLAQRRGLTPIVTTTTTRIGNYYDNNYSNINNQRSEWDLLTFLAQQEDFACFVSGMELHFQPKPTPNDKPYVLQYSAPNNANGYPTLNAMSITLSRNLTLARDVIVTVRSWNKENKRAFTRTAKAVHNKNTVISGKAQPIGDSQVYTRRIAGLTPEQALQKAQEILQQITQHEKVIHVTMPADNVLSVENIILLKGTASDFDQVYFPDSIVRSMSFDGGYEMRIEAKNHAPDSEVLV